MGGQLRRKSPQWTERQRWLGTGSALGGISCRNVPDKAFLKSLRGPRMQGGAAGRPGDPVPVCGRTMGGMRSLSAGLTLDI